MKKLIVLLIACAICLPSVAFPNEEESWEEFIGKKGEAEETKLIPKGQQGLKLIPKDVIIEELSKPPQSGQTGAAVGPIVVLTSESILFEYGSSRLTENSFPQLREIAAALTDSRLAAIPLFYVDGHTCDIGSDGNNCRLSWDRARSVVNHLTSVGRVPSDKLRARGFGKRDPMRPNTSESERRLNRRVVLQSGLVAVVPRDQSKMCSESEGSPGTGGSQEQYQNGHRPSQVHYPGPVDNEPYEPVFGGLRGSSKSKEAERSKLPQVTPLKQSDLPAGFKRIETPKDQKDGYQGVPKGLPSTETGTR